MPDLYPILHLLPIAHPASSGSGIPLPASGNTVTVSSTPYTIQSTDYYILVDTSASSKQLNLPAPSGRSIFFVKDKTGNANTNKITLHRNGSENIEGIAADKSLTTDWGSWIVFSDGTNWFLL